MLGVYRFADQDTTEQSVWTNFMFGAPAPAEPIYKGAGTRSTQYLGVKTDADLYLGAKTLWP